MRWYKKFFDKKYGKFILNNYNDSREKSKKIFQLLDIKEKDTIFDQCCGRGILSETIMKNGNRVIGIDYNRSYLAKIDKKLIKKTKSIFLKKNAFKYRVKNRVDIVINWHSSFGYGNNQENFNQLKNAYKSLKKGGVFLIDYLNSSKIIAHFEKKMVFKLDNSLSLVRFSKIEKNILYQQWFLYKNNLLLWEKESYIKLYTLKFFKNNLKKIGFEIINLYGNYDKSKYTKNSDRLIIICKKV